MRGRHTPFYRLPHCEEYKRYPDGRVARYPLRLLELRPAQATTVYVSEGGFELAGTWIPRGTVTLGLFWPHRPYNVYAWMNRSLTAPLALYCNVSDGCALGAHTIHWRDLWVDVVLRPSGRAEVLDRDEVPTDTTASLRRYLEGAVDRLLRHHRALENEVAAAVWTLRYRRDTR